MIAKQSIAKVEQPTNYALMAFTSSGSSSSLDSEVDSCSKTCVKAYTALKEQYDNLNSDYKKSQFNFMSIWDVTTVVTPSNDKTVENKGVSNTVETNVVRINNSSAPIIEDWNSDDESERF
ncbi:hypothetical protein Tco_0774008 [Tanacetum coccineum]|uniref:Uncharacterized protein n=1 Tax=Tanacetum coccineum TaxID=301880 RepID=A0ABQ4ZQE1_9ASTR